MNRTEFPDHIEAFLCSNADEARKALIEIVGQGVFTHQILLDSKPDRGMLYLTNPEGARGMAIRINIPRDAESVARYLFSSLLLDGIKYPNPPRNLANPTKGWRIEKILIEGIHPAAAVIQVWV